jgi:hypothetical protein
MVASLKDFYLFHFPKLIICTNQIQTTIWTARNRTIVAQLGALTTTQEISFYVCCLSGLQRVVELLSAFHFSYKGVTEVHGAAKSRELSNGIMLDHDDTDSDLKVLGQYNTMPTIIVSKTMSESP